MTRRHFLGAAGLAATAVAAVADGGEEKTTNTKLLKAVNWGMLPGDLSVEDRMALAAKVGYDGIEMPPGMALDDARAHRVAAEAHGLQLHSIIHGGWEAPLSSGDPAVVDRGKESIANSLRLAGAYGASCVLVVPAIVNGETRYVDAYNRSQAALRELAPLARSLKVTIAVENVWNNFLMSPLEFARYVDEIDSAYVKAYFDVGNVIAFGWSEDWILTLGARIKRIHLKDFKRGPRSWENLLDGDVNWPAVRAALTEVGYSGFCTCELSGGDEAYLTDLAARVDKIFAGA